MTLEESIKRLAKANIDENNDWYSWRKINESRLPKGILLPEGNQYRKNIALKTILSEKLQSTSSREERKEIFRYYVSTWGGIRNSEATLSKYTESTPEELVAMGANGIASWSKILCILQPSNFAIYDARVSASLNALQIIDNTENAKIYPMLSSRNNTIKKGTKLIKSYAEEHSWGDVSRCDFYGAYLNYLTKTAIEREKFAVSISTIEMLLFAKAEELVQKAFPNEEF